MAGSSFGTIFRITTWGESHGKGLGVVIDGCPSGIELCEEDIQRMLDRRRPGVSNYTTSRKESDKAVIMSGVFEGKTTGTPISIMVYNEDHHSEDYSDIANFYRPGHADIHLTVSTVSGITEAADVLREERRLQGLQPEQLHASFCRLSE